MLKRSKNVPVSQVAKAFAVICLSIWLFPIYQDGTTSLLSTATGIARTGTNRELFAVVGFSIWVPMAFAWRRSLRLGASIQIGVLVGLLLWLHVVEPAALRIWSSYSLLLLGACSALWFLMLAAGVMRGALSSKKSE